jgi:hypothetical protein
MTRPRGKSAGPPEGAPGRLTEDDSYASGDTSAYRGVRLTLDVKCHQPETDTVRKTALLDLSGVPSRRNPSMPAGDVWGGSGALLSLVKPFAREASNQLAAERRRQGGWDNGPTDV